MESETHAHSRARSLLPCTRTLKTRLGTAQPRPQIILSASLLTQLRALPAQSPHSTPSVPLGCPEQPGKEQEGHSSCPRHELLPRDAFTRRPRALSPSRARSQRSAEPVTPCPGGHRHCHSARTSPGASPCQSQPLLIPALAKPSPLPLPSRCRAPLNPPVEGLMSPLLHRNVLPGSSPLAPREVQTYPKTPRCPPGHSPNTALPPIPTPFPHLRSGNALPRSPAHGPGPQIPTPGPSHAFPLPPPPKPLSLSLNSRGFDTWDPPPTGEPPLPHLPPWPLFPLQKSPAPAPLQSPPRSLPPWLQQAPKARGAPKSPGFHPRAAPALIQLSEKPPDPLTAPPSPEPPFPRS